MVILKNPRKTKKRRKSKKNVVLQVLKTVGKKLIEEGKEQTEKITSIKLGQW